LPLGRRRPALRILILAAVTLPLTTLSLSIQTGAQAAPTRTAQLKAQLDKLNQQADQLVEAYDKAKDDLGRTQAVLKSLKSDEVQAGQTLQQLQQRLGDRAAVAYMQGPGNALASLLNGGNPADTIDRMQLLDMLAQQDGDLAAALRVAGKNFGARKAALQAAEAEQAASLAALAKKRDAAQATAAKTQRLLDSLQAADRTALLGAAPSATKPPPINASGAVKAVLAYAYAQVGKPYAFGAAGPSSFDCSGLTMMAWAQAGVSLPHSSSGQYDAVAHVSLSQKQPGDLLFYYSPISHVAIYVGNGMQIAATHTGDFVRLQAIHSGLVAAGRP
jgi:cell wall-associated NlpC family hydrolase